VDPASNNHWVVLAYHLAEVSRRGKVMMQSAIGHEEYLTSGQLTIQYPADIYAGLADKVTAKLQDDFRVRHAASNYWQQYT